MKNRKCIYCREQIVEVARSHPYMCKDCEIEIRRSDLITEMF